MKRTFLDGLQNLMFLSALLFSASLIAVDDNGLKESQEGQVLSNELNGSDKFLKEENNAIDQQQVSYIEDQAQVKPIKNYPYDNIKPKAVPHEEGEIIAPKQKEELPKSNNKILDNKLLVKELNGIYFYDDPNKMGNLVDFSKGIHEQNCQLPYLKELSKKLFHFLNKPIFSNTLQLLEQEIISFYKEKGYSLVSVSFPSGQDISDGYIKVIIVFGRLGKIIPEGGKYFPAKNLVYKMRCHQGEIINSNEMLADLEWLNNNPFRTVDFVYQPGEKFGQTDLLLKVEDKFPLRVYAGYQNSGYEVAGNSRYFAGFNWGKAFGSEEQLNCQFMSAANIHKWWSVSGNYIIPLPWRDYFKIYGSYVEVKPDMDESFYNKGKGSYIGLRYEFILPNLTRLSQTLSLGFDFKHANNFLSYASDLIYQRYSDIDQFIIKYEATIPDRFGSGILGGSIIMSPGGITRYNTNAYFQAQRAGASANYIYGTFNYDRTTKLPLNCSWILSFLVQMSTGKLLPTEELSIGGQYTVRGYKENALVGDHGFLFKNELRFPSINFNFRYGSSRQIKNELQFLAFVDMGWADDVDKNIVDCHAEVLASIGPGCRLRLNDFLDVRYDYGFQLKSNSHRIIGESNKSRGHFSLQFSY
jgi:hemolysin activation/secretion protein